MKVIYELKECGILIVKTKTSGKSLKSKDKRQIIKDNTAKSHNQKPSDIMDVFIVPVRSDPGIIMLYAGE